MNPLARADDGRAHHTHTHCARPALIGDARARAQVQRKSDNKMYALKRIDISKMSKREVADALNEVRKRWRVPRARLLSRF